MSTPTAVHEDAPLNGVSKTTTTAASSTFGTGSESVLRSSVVAAATSLALTPVTSSIRRDSHLPATALGPGGDCAEPPQKRLCIDGAE